MGTDLSKEEIEFSEAVSPISEHPTIINTYSSVEEAKNVNDEQPDMHDMIKESEKKAVSPKHWKEIRLQNPDPNLFLIHSRRDDSSVETNTYEGKGKRKREEEVVSVESYIDTAEDIDSNVTTDQYSSKKAKSNIVINHYLKSDKMRKQRKVTLKDNGHQQKKHRYTKPNPNISFAFFKHQDKKKEHSTKERVVTPKDNLEYISVPTSYTGNQNLKPPQYPLTPIDVIIDERCDYCGKVGESCFNRKHGRFCVAIVYRYYRESRDSYDSLVAIQKFKEAFRYSNDCSLYQESYSLNRSSCLKLPGCMIATSLLFSLNLIDWEIMVKDAHSSAGFW